MKLKIFDYLWHIPHQCDMIYALRNDCDFSFGLNTKGQWDHGKRAMPANLRFVTHYEEGEYDFAILHIDQQVASLKDRKYLIYNDFNRNIRDIPKIVVNHGSPVLTEWFRQNEYDYTDDHIKEICIREVTKLIGNNIMVVNSHTAATEKEWGFGHPIIHGMNAADWFDVPKEPRVFTAVSPGGFDRYYNRECLNAVAEILPTIFGYTLNHAKVNVNTGTAPDAYKKYLGASLLYFDSSFRTPMNRARTEAFLSGCCVVQVEGAHDLERWAIPGVNMIVVPNDPHTIAATIADLIENRYQEAVEIGQRGKEMAEREFASERYRQDWLNVFDLASRKNTSEIKREACQ